jgi:hypothetical protein
MSFKRPKTPCLQVPFSKKGHAYRLVGKVDEELLEAVHLLTTQTSQKSSTASDGEILQVVGSFGLRTNASSETPSSLHVFGRVHFQQTLKDLKVTSKDSNPKISRRQMAP